MYIRVMTINLWNSCSEVTNGLKKLSKFITFINPDIVALQEIRDTKTVPILLKLLGEKWFGHTDFGLGGDSGYPDTGFLSRHPLTTLGTASLKTNDVTTVKVEILGHPSRVLSLWSAHLTANSYGPYAAMNKLCTEAFQIMVGEEQDGLNGRPSRLRSTENLVISEDFQLAIERADREPMILMGDLNSPSHLDWTESTRSQHGDWVYKWPVTKLLEESGFQDAFRQLYPDPLTHPGNTWSPVVQYTWSGEWGYSIPEPQDRIDYILYGGSGLKPVSAFVYCGNETTVIKASPHHLENDWPSDHAAVVLDFQLKALQV